MANRFWNKQNASPNWNATAPTNWGSASNTADNASVPGSGDDVFFDGVGGGVNNSTISANITIRSLDCTGYVNTITQNNATTLTIAGNGVDFKLSSGMTYSPGGATSFLAFTGTSGTNNIYSFGKSMPGLTIDGAGGTTQLQDDYSANVFAPITITNGTFSTNNKNITAYTFNSTNTNVRTINLGSSLISLFGSSTSFWNTATSTNLTLNAGTSTIKATANSAGTKFFNGGGKTYNNVWFATQGTGPAFMVGSNTFNDLKINPGVELRFAINITQIVTTLTASGILGSLVKMKSSTNGNTWTISKTSGTVSLDYVSLQDSTASGGASFYAGDNSTNVSGNTGWTFTAPPAGGTKSLQGVSTIQKISSIIL